jgi:hypothetical protein
MATRKPELQVGRDGISRKLGWFSIGLGLTELAIPRALSRAIGVTTGGHTTTTVRAMGAREIAQGIALLLRPHRAGPLWTRVVGDVIDLALLAYAVRAKRSSGARLGLAIASVLGVALIDVLASRRVHTRGERTASYSVSLT